MAEVFVVSGETLAGQCKGSGEPAECEEAKRFSQTRR